MHYKYVFSKRRVIFTCVLCHSSLKERVRNDRLEVPSMISSIYEETDAGNFNNVINVYKCICVCDFFLSVSSVLSKSKVLRKNSKLIL